MADCALGLRGREGSDLTSDLSDILTSDPRADPRTLTSINCRLLSCVGSSMCAVTQEWTMYSGNVIELHRDTYSAAWHALRPTFRVNVS